MSHTRAVPEEVLMRYLHTKTYPIYFWHIGYLLCYSRAVLLPHQFSILLRQHFIERALHRMEVKITICFLFTCWRRQVLVLLSPRYSSTSNIFSPFDLLIFEIIKVPLQDKNCVFYDWYFWSFFVLPQKICIWWRNYGDQSKTLMWPWLMKQYLIANKREVFLNWNLQLLIHNSLIQKECMSICCINLELYLVL